MMSHSAAAPTTTLGRVWSPTSDAHRHPGVAVEHERPDVDRHGHQPQRCQEPVVGQLRRRRAPHAGAERDAPRHDQGVAGERDERARPGDIPQDHAVTSAHAGRDTEPPSTITMAASSSRRCARAGARAPWRGRPRRPGRRRRRWHGSRAGRARRRVDQMVRGTAVAVTASGGARTPRSRRPGPPRPRTRATGAGIGRARGASTATRCRPRAATRSPPASTRTAGSSHRPRRRPAARAAIQLLAMPPRSSLVPAGIIAVP